MHIHTTMARISRPLLLLAPIVLIGAIACEATTEDLIAGVLQNVDSVNGEITVTLENGQNATFSIGNDTSVETDGDASEVESLEPGATVKLSVGPDGTVAQSVLARLARIEGTVTAIDGAQITIETGNGRSRTLNVTTETQFELGDDFPGVAADLVVGNQVTAKFDPSNFSILKINAGDEFAEIEGAISEITDRGFVIKTPKGRRLELVVDENTVIDGEGNLPGQLSDLIVGADAEVDFDPFTRVATKVDFEYEADEEDEATEGDEGAESDDGTQIAGIIVAISENQLSVIMPDGQEHDFVITTDTRFETGEILPGAYTDFTSGDPVQVTIDPVTLTAVEVSVRDSNRDGESDEEDED